MQAWMAVGLQLLILVVGVSGFAFLMKGSLEGVRKDVNKLDESMSNLSETLSEFGQQLARHDERTSGVIHTMNKLENRVENIESSVQKVLQNQAIHQSQRR